MSAAGSKNASFSSGLDAVIDAAENAGYPRNPTVAPAQRVDEAAGTTLITDDDPGVTLKEVALRHVILATSAGESRLEFDKAAREIAPRVAAAVSEANPDRRRETLEFRTGLMPLKEDGRVKGFAIRPGAKLAIFQRAGLKPGDVIVSINGQAFRSEEKVLELSAELASARTIEIAFVRDGRRMTGKVEQNSSQR